MTKVALAKSSALSADDNNNQNNHNKTSITSIAITVAPRADGLVETAARVDSSNNDERLFKLSRRRWALLAAITTFGFFNGLVNDLFAILNTQVALMGISLETYVYLNQSFSYLSPLLALPSAWFVDRYGIRVAAHVALFLAALRNCSRALLFSPTSLYWHELRFVYWVTANLCKIQVVIIYYCLPLKVSEGWFSKDERSLAWSFMVVGPLLGSAIASLTVPRYVTGVDSIQPLAYVNLAALLISIVAITSGVQRPSPKEAPSERCLNASNDDKQPIWVNVRQLLTNGNLMLHVMTLGSFDSMTLAIKNVMQDVLAASGFSSIFCGQFLASESIASVVLQLFSSALLADRAGGEKGSTLVCKRYLALQCVAFCFSCASLAAKDLLADQQWWIVIATGLAYTFCRFWFSPAYMNLSAHLIAGSISPATLSAASTITNCVLANIYTVAFVALRRVDSTDPSSVKTNYLHSVLFLACLASAISLLYVACFSGRRKSQVSTSSARTASKGDCKTMATDESACGSGEVSAMSELRPEVLPEVAEHTVSKTKSMTAKASL